MFKFALVALAAACVSAVDMNTQVNDDAHIASINAVATTWTAGKNARFEGHALSDVARLCGVNTPLEQRVRLPFKNATYDADAIPTEFDARQQWSECPLIGKARDQSACGSCWAFGSTESFNDRVCIASKGKFQTELSAQDTASCCKGLECGFSMGCNGGQPTAAWSWFTKVGVVSGAGYDTIGSGSSCWPYQLPICSHHVSDPKIKNCTESEYPTPSCRSTCSESKYSTPFGQDRTVAKSAYNLRTVADIQNDIMTLGSVSAAFTVYADFPTYTGGVYQHHSNQELGGHAIKIFGWGVESGTPFWWVMNSWNQDWGINGAFKILRGSDECGIEDDVSAGHV